MSSFLGLMECSPPDSSVHGIFQARILECVAISFSTGSSQPRDPIRVSRIVGWLAIYLLSHQGSPVKYIDMSLIDYLLQ